MSAATDADYSNLLVLVLLHTGTEGRVQGEAGAGRR